MPFRPAHSRRWLRVASGAALAAMCLTGQPAAAQYRVDHWTTDNGLPQNSVLALLQTRDGYLWAATPDGLVRFDGVGFTLYNKATTPGLTTNRFCALFETADGTVWIGTEDRGVVRYRDGAFQTFGVESGLPHSWVWSIRAGHDGRLLVFTRFGAAVFDGAAFRPAGGRQTYPVTARWAPGTMLDSAGLIRFDGQDTRTQPYPADVGSGAVGAVVEDNRGDLWLITRDGRYFHLSDGRWAPRPADPGLALNPRAIHADAAGRIWMPTLIGVRVYESSGRAEEVDLLLNTAGDGFFAMVQDREGSLWLGSVRSGLFRVRHRVVEILGRDAGLADDNVYPLTEDAAGRVWVGTWGGGLHRLSRDGVKRWNLRDGMPGDISALYADRDGSMVAGVMNHGIVIIGTDDRVHSAIRGALPDRVVSAILRDPAGTLWLGTNKGLVAVDGASVERVLTVADGLPDNRIRVLTGDAGGRLWIGTQSGVAVLAGGVVTTPPGAEVLAGDQVRVIHPDDERTTWIGTADAGLVRLRDGRATRYTTATGLASNGVFAILDDGADGFWTSSNLGLARTTRRELNDFAEGRIPLVTARSFTRADGLATLEANGGRQPSAFRARDGRLWFATARGAAIVDPSRIASATPPLAPVIERVSVDGRATAHPDRVDVEPGEAYVSVGYSVGLVASPETVRFRVRLVGLDESWHDVGTQRNMVYSRLRHGTYRFEVAAVSNGQVGPVTALPLRVHPRFHETPAFAVLAIATASGVVFLAVQKRAARRKRLQRQEREFAVRLLESQDRERERLAADVHDGLGQHLLVIRNQALLGAELSGGAEGCLGAIADAAALGLEEVRTLAAALHPATLQRLGLIRALAAMIRTLSTSTAISISLAAPENRRLPSGVELQLYRIVQQCLSNALRHSGASVVMVSVAFGDAAVEVIVRDDGHGFEPSRLALREDVGLGLTSIRERARSLGAELSVESATGRGTTVRVRMPITVPQETDAGHRP